jgi:hypothetical protein
MGAPVYNIYLGLFKATPTKLYRMQGKNSRSGSKISSAPGHPVPFKRRGSAAAVSVFSCLCLASEMLTRTRTADKQSYGVIATGVRAVAGWQGSSR